MNSTPAAMAGPRLVRIRLAPFPGQAHDPACIA
jgi:hypothetical protein